MGIIERSNIIEPAGVHAEFQKAGPLEAGDFANQAEKAARAVDTVNAVLYINTGTKTAPVWEVVGEQS